MIKKLLLSSLLLLPSLSYSAFRTDYLTVNSSETVKGQISVQSVLYPDGTVQVSSPTTGGSSTVIISTLTAGATNFIFNTSELQSGATFYVSSGTINGSFTVGTPISGRALQFLPSASDATLHLYDTGSPGWGMQFHNTSGQIPGYFSQGSSGFIIGVSTNSTTAGLKSRMTINVNSSTDLTDFEGTTQFSLSVASVAINNTLQVSTIARTASIEWLDGSVQVSSPTLRGFRTVFNAEEAKLPGVNPCIITNSSVAVSASFLCDASTDESATWSTILYPYNGSNLKGDIYYTMVSTNSGNIVHNLSLMCVSDGDSVDLDTESFDLVEVSTSAVPSTAGYMKVASITMIHMDNCAANDIMILKYNRDADSSDDTAGGDVEIRKILFYEP